MSTFITLLGAIGSRIIEQTQANIAIIHYEFSMGGIEALKAIPPLVVLILEASLLGITFRVLRMIWFLSREMHIFHRLRAYSSPGTPGGKRILVVGDSTAYGTGASRPEDTIAGRLAHDFPSAEVINKSVNGSLTSGAIEQLRSVNGMFDLIIVCTGGNDMVRLTRLASIERSLTQLLEEASARSNHQVIVLFYSNLANTPIFPSLIRYLLGARSRGVHEVFSRVTTSFEVPLVELFTNAGTAGTHLSSNPFIDDPEMYYAPDRMHPNSEGYKLWYNRMWREMVTRHFTFAAERPVQLGATPGADRF